jgi:peptide/nickel transport system permease protein
MLTARIGRSVIALAIVVVVTFVFVHLVPGDPARAILGPQASASSVDALRSQLGLDDPITAQFGRYVAHVVQGDLGDSVANRVPVSDLVGTRLMPTVWLILYAALMTVLITVPLAVLAALKRDGFVDHTIRLVPILGLGLPAFWLALVLIQWLAVDLGVFPAGGYGTTALGHLQALTLPAFVVAVSILPFTIQSLRVSIVEVLDADHVAAARARGVPARTVLVRHVLRNALIPTIAVLGLNVGWLIGNTIVVEKIFAIQGLGSLLIDSILSRDFPVVQGLALVIATLVIAVNLLTDVARSVADPRLRSS